MLVEEEAFWIDAITEHLEAKAKAISGDEDAVDWDDTYGTEG